MDALPRASLGVGASTRASLASTRIACSAELAWLALATAGAFAIASASSAAGLTRSAFILPHTLFAAGIVLTYVVWTRTDARAFWGADLGRAAIATAIAAVYVTFSVLRQPASAHATGAALVLDLVWSGLVYGLVDGALLSALPFLVARRLGEAWAPGSRLVPIALAIVASAAILAVYHLGFPEFQGPALVYPVVGVTALTALTALSRSAAPAVVGHVVMHVAAVVHGPASVLQLPPHAI